jgi:CRP/FNR family cyclic AMP-dependent transcriptional regulator
VAEPGLPPGALAVPEKLTQQDIAERVGSSREMVGRVIKPLVDGGWLALQDGRLLLLKPLPARP